MKLKSVWLLWLYLFILTAVLGFIPQPGGFLKILLIALAVIFFIPGFVILVKADHRDDIKSIRLVRTIAISALAVSTAMIMLNFLSAILSDAWGQVLHWMLVIFSAPMFCGQYWVLSLFGWAFLMVYAITLLKQWK